MIKIKNLFVILSREGAEKLCKKKNWKLLTLKEANENRDLIEHEIFWLKEFVPDLYADEKNATRPSIFEKGEATAVSPLFKFNLVVWEEEKICKHCGKSCE